MSMVVSPDETFMLQSSYESSVWWLGKINTTDGALISISLQGSFTSTAWWMSISGNWAILNNY